MNVMLVSQWAPYPCLKIVSYCLVESRRSCRPSYHHFGQRGGHRFLQALHELRYIHHDQEAHQVQARRLLLPGPTSVWDLDVYCVCLHWRECGAILG